MRADSMLPSFALERVADLFVSIHCCLLSFVQVKNVEDAMRRRIAIGSKCRKATVLKELERQGYEASAIARALHLMVRVGDMREDDGGRSITRVK